MICRLKSKISASFGLVALHDKNYHAAALKFIECHAEIGATYNEVLHAEDIALYGGICALASFTRKELREKVRLRPPLFFFVRLMYGLHLTVVYLFAEIVDEQFVVQGVFGIGALAARVDQRLLLQQLRVVSPNPREHEGTCPLPWRKEATDRMLTFCVSS